jgi:hypothetical protein
MKKLIFSSLVGLALVAFTGCTNGSDAETEKCQSGKCDGAQKCDAKTPAKKCDGASSAVEKCGK